MKNKIFVLVIVLFLWGCDENQVKGVPQANVKKALDIPQDKVMKEQTIYVPVYSSIYARQEKSLIHLTITLSIRNTSLKNSIIITDVKYYDTNGKLIRNYISDAFALDVLATKDYVVREDDLEGGTGANFVVKWKSEYEVSQPIIQAIMISAKNSLGVSFVCEGHEIVE